jgi:hypothetical protein
MAIPLAQLETWSGQGAIKTSKDTYATVKAALEDADANYKDWDFKVFLQGSYGNDTNIYAESDVDVVIRYDGVFYHNIKELPPEDQVAFQTANPGHGAYSYSDFKGHVLEALKAKFGNSVKPGTKAIKIEGSGNRRNADVIVAYEYRRYFKFKASYDEEHVKGICFFLPDWTRVANYPNLHCENLTTKHQATNNKFKPTVRIFKNMRSKMVGDKLIKEGSAPSYYIEGLLYNVPDDKFVGNCQEITRAVLQWLSDTPDRSKFVCANKQYYLLHDNSHTCWATADGKNYIDAAIKLWNDWK